MELYCSMGGGGGGNVGATNIWAGRDPVPPRKPPTSALCYLTPRLGSPKQDSSLRAESQDLKVYQRSTKGLPKVYPRSTQGLPLYLGHPVLGQRSSTETSQDEKTSYGTRLYCTGQYK